MPYGPAGTVWVCRTLSKWPAALLHAPFRPRLAGPRPQTPPVKKDESVEIGDVQLVAMRHQLGHLVQDTLAERQDGYNIRGLQAVQLLPKLHEKVHKFSEVGASVIKHDRTKSLFDFHIVCVRERNRMTRLAAESAFIGRRDAEVVSDWSRPLIRVPKHESLYALA
ncbi:hypothetical protein NPIL_132101 [Nephila pilipes]|uniref:Uncharacterized protein n=1 Tax=Nephila pilipes TaxID=299642 RepID=A0A8X6PE03_NEPPI|nr:hypothetical protein NPIL_132101 [Nephila pilipes]